MSSQVQSEYRERFLKMKLLLLSRAQVNETQLITAGTQVQVSIRSQIPFSKLTFLSSRRISCSQPQVGFKNHFDVSGQQQVGVKNHFGFYKEPEDFVKPQVGLRINTSLAT